MVEGHRFEMHFQPDSRFKVLAVSYRGGLMTSRSTNIYIGFVSTTQYLYGRTIKVVLERILIENEHKSK